MAKAMHKESLHDTFEIMEAPVVQSICLNRVIDTFSLVTKERVHRKVVEHGIDKQGAKVFEKEQGTI